MISRFLSQWNQLNFTRLPSRLKYDGAQKIPVAVPEKRRTQPQAQVSITRQAADGIITFAKTWHPNEAILILQEKRRTT